MPEKFTPNEAMLIAAEEGLEIVLTAASMPNMLAALILIMQDIIDNNCSCDSCTRIREVMDNLS